MLNFTGIIPARYHSKRLKGKPLLDIAGKSMIQRVYEQAQKALNHVFVATDDERIVQHVESFGGQAIMTSSCHVSGTDRCLEALDYINSIYPDLIDVIINIQGDEPLLAPAHIDDLKSCFRDPETQLATLVVSVHKPEDLENESEVFVTFDKNHYALYFSRSVIPYVVGLPKSAWLDRTSIYKHLGIYAYTTVALRRFANLAPTNLENIESLEQNRWLEHGHRIKIALTKYDTISVDTQEDLEKIRQIFYKVS